ncbi:MAG: ubiquitin-conjugating enzyme E2 [Bacillota bacterium]|nr:ubiquitin-conjugating enzyme E2 [Bacillota bacterium]
MNLRLKRLANDYNQIQQYLIDNPHIILKRITGNPPEKYYLEYNVRSIQIINNVVSEINSHQVEITIPLEYPSIQPQCRMLTPVFHPNIAPHAICIADHWAAGESLKDVVIRIGEMLTYQNYSIKSPLNGEAAKWASENQHRFPLDHIDFRMYGSNTMLNNSLQFSSASVNTAVLQSPSESSKCSNCGNKSSKQNFLTCRNDHNICVDCQVKCQNCGKTLCIICETKKCAVCGKISCMDCMEFCPSCSKYHCSSHTKECHICGEKNCFNCIIECPQCGLYVCGSHFKNNENMCFSCFYK